MYQQEFDLQVSRLEDVYGKMDDGIIRELTRCYINLDPRLWRRIVSWVIEHAHMSPRPAKFAEAKRECLKSWKLEDLDGRKTDGSCAECGHGHGFLTVYYYVAYGEEKLPYRSVAPCKTCNRDQIVPRPRAELTFVSREEWAVIVNERQRKLADQKPRRIVDDLSVEKQLERIVEEAKAAMPEGGAR